MKKITVKTPLVEMNGDEMTRIIWDMIKEKIILKHLDIKLVSHDLSVENRDKTDDQVTKDAAHAIAEYKVGVKCATITPDAGRVEEYNLKKQWKSPNGTIRNILNGTIFRRPIVVKNIKPFVRTWKKPIIIGRHAYGDLYNCFEYRFEGTGQTAITLESHDGENTHKQEMFNLKGPGIFMGMHNTDESIRAFAQNSIRYALSEKLNLWHSVKDTISKSYHCRFKEIFQEEIDKHQDEFKAAGIEYRYLLIDDAVAQAMKSEGGFVWALRNYDGDVMSDMVASGFGSLGMMTSVLVTPDGAFEYEAAHGTVKRHYYEHLKGNPTSTNSVASLFVWVRGLRKRGEMDGTQDLIEFTHHLEDSIIELIESGVVTKDLIPLMENKTDSWETTESFIDKVANKLESKLG